MEEVNKKLAEFFTEFKQRRYKKGEILIRADDDPAGAFYLKDGLVKVYAISKKGDELLLNIFKPASFFPMSWVISDEKNHYYYEAMRDSRIFIAPKERVKEFIKKNPDVLYDLIQRLYKGVEGMLARMAYLLSGDAYSRLVAEIITESKRFGEKNNEKEISLHISERDIASQTGLTRETVSREIKILKEKKLVGLSKKVLTIKDIKRLEDELF